MVHLLVHLSIHLSIAYFKANLYCVHTQNNEEDYDVLAVVYVLNNKLKLSYERFSSCRSCCI